MPALPFRRAFRSALLLGGALIGLSVTATAAATPVTVVLGYIPDVEDFAFWAQGSWLLDFEPTAPEPMHVGSLTTARVRCVR